MRKLICCCGTATEVPEGSVGDHLRNAPGWSFVWDQSNGLEIVWVCPPCSSEARKAIEALRLVFKGQDLSNLHLGPIIRERR